MKLPRILLLLAVVLVGLLVLGLGLALTPGVQRWALLRAVAAQPGLEVSVGRVAVGFSRLEVRDLEARQGGMKFSVAELQGEHRLLALLGGRLELTRLRGRGLEIDISRIASGAASAGAAASPAAAPGALARQQLPFGLVLGEVDLAGSALLPGAAGGPAIRAEFRITGGGVAPGQSGALQLQASITNPAVAARVSTLDLQAALRLKQSLERTFSGVGVSATVDAAGSGLSAPARLGIEAEYRQEAAAEAYSLQVDSRLGGQAETLVRLTAAVPAGGGAFAGDWHLHARTAQVEPFYLGGGLPEFTASGEGRLSLDPASGRVAAAGRLEVRASQFERVEPALRALGSVQITTRFDLAHEAQTLRVESLDLTLAGPQPVLELRTQRPVVVDLAQGTLAVGGASEGEALRLKLIGLPLAWVRPFVTAVDLSGGVVTGDLAIASAGGTLSVGTVTPLRANGVNVVQAGEVLLQDATFSVDAGAELTEGQWRARVRALELQTAAGDRVAAQLQIDLKAGPDPQVRLVGSYEARVPTLLRAYAGDFQAQAAGEVDLQVQGTELRVDRFSTRVSSLDGRPMLAADARQPFTFALDRRTITSRGTGRELLRLELGRMDLGALLGPWVEGLRGVVDTGVFSLEAESGAWTLRPVQPLVVTGLDLMDKGAPQLGGVTLELSPRVEVDAAGVVLLQSGNVTLRTSGGTVLATGTVEVADAAVVPRVAGKFLLELPALGRLPALALATPLEQGRATGELRAVLAAADQQVEARFTLNGLVARGVAGLLPVANVSLRATRQPDGAMTVEVPVLLDRAGVRSDLSFSASLARGGAGHVIKARLTAERASVDDLLALAGVFSSAAGGTTAPTTSAIPSGPIVADTVPAWSRVSGEVELDFKALTYGTEFTATGLKGQLRVEPGRITLPGVQASFGPDGRLDARGDLVFEAGARPYRLNASFAVTEFDVTPVFRAIDPSRPPTLEGRFNVEGRLVGGGRTVGETLERTTGSFQLTSRQGVFRGLKRGTERISVATRAVELGAALGSILGSGRVREVAERAGGGAFFADQLAQEFGELKYDQFSVRLERAENLDVRLTEIALISPEVRLLGQGRVTHQEGKPWLDQPLAVEMTLAGRGKIETLLTRARLIEGPTARDDLGYARARYPIVIGGTPAKPDALSFYTRLATSKLLESLAPEN